jgi:hypothetical protein
VIFPLAGLGIAVEAKPAEVSFEKLREVAVRYAQKTSKAQLLETLKPFLPAGDPKLTLIQDRAGAIALLEKALVA